MKAVLSCADTVPTRFGYVRRRGIAMKTGLVPVSGHIGAADYCGQAMRARAAPTRGPGSRYMGATALDTTAI